MADRPRRSESERERLRRISILNARLPKKRTIGQGVLRNPAGEVLLCELSYKKEWDLPGGVVDPGESPATCVEREVEEELGIHVTAGRLLAVNWLPPWRGWDDAMLYLFDLGVHDTGELDDGDVGAGGDGDERSGEGQRAEAPLDPDGHAEV